jgi:hypothetical protein
VGTHLNGHRCVHSWNSQFNGLRGAGFRFFEGLFSDWTVWGGGSVIAKAIRACRGGCFAAVKDGFKVAAFCTCRNRATVGGAGVQEGA